MNIRNSIKIVMFHYVRDLKRSRFPRINGLDVLKFRRQVTELNKTHRILSFGEFYNFAENKLELPSNSCLLTFDDGYTDHYTYAYPILDELKLSGCFFPVAEATMKRKLLDVNKIHFLIASLDNYDPIVRAIDETASAVGNLSNYRAEYWKKNRFDGEQVNYIKRMLQTALPDSIRQELASILFSKYVTNDELCFAEELYMSETQLKTLSRAGAHIGSHGWSHCWIANQSPANVRQELELSKTFISTITNNSTPLSICYPYGNHSPNVISTAAELGYCVGFTTNPSIADLNVENLLTLSRLDTNDVT